ncbi:MAG: hypothetical protein IT368_01710, partial [Candidatus Hydrogenedentes bacterium]|nr:hypothetical protein [Candidatus Hydrogenedentota bacterium]
MSFRIALVLLLVAGGAGATLNIPEADGSDGPFEPTGASYIVDLSLADDVNNLSDAHTATEGVYLADQWVVVFRYTSVNIPTGTTVTFTNHPSGAPVMWLVSGDVVIDGTVSLDGQAGHPMANRYFAEPGPGGFRGGLSRTSTNIADETTGFGPGGGGIHLDPGQTLLGSYGTVGTYGLGRTYGNTEILPLIGGSGGAGTTNVGYTGGGAGGGAIFIASISQVSIMGSIHANGGDAGKSHAGGSGGAIKIVADAITGSGTLNATGGYSASSAIDFSNGGFGRIYLAANSNLITTAGTPAYAAGVPSDPIVLFPSTLSPKAYAIKLDEVDVPADPRGEGPVNADLGLENIGPRTLTIGTEYINPEGGTVAVRVIPHAGPALPEIFAVPVAGGTFAFSTWTATVDLPAGYTTIQVYA